MPTSESSRKANKGGQRVLRNLKWFAVGALIGAVSFVFAMAAMPSSISSLSRHDLVLANNLGIIFPPLLGFWVGFVERSLARALVGIAIGVILGTAYKALCGFNFLAVMVVYPCVLGGFAALALGRGSSSWSEGCGWRFLKGLAAGFALGAIYMVALNVFGILLHGIQLYPPSVRAHREMMWFAGTLALTIASGVFFVVFAWAANLNCFSVRATAGEALR